MTTPKKTRRERRKRPAENLEGEGWPEESEPLDRGSRQGPPVRPRNDEAEEYEAEMMEELVVPMMVRMRGRLEMLQSTFDQVSMLTDFSPGGELAEFLSEQAIDLAISLAQDFVERIAERHTAQFGESMSRAIGIDVKDLGDDAIRDTLRSAASENANLIQSVPERQMGFLTSAMEELAETAPFDQQQIAQLLDRTGRLTQSTVRRISRDQSSKLIGRLNEVRQTQLGITSYKWSTSIDRRVRPTHRANEGKVFRWDSPPPLTGHPGRDINCRCVALAVLDPELRASPGRTGAAA